MAHPVYSACTLAKQKSANTKFEYLQTISCIYFWIRFPYFSHQFSLHVTLFLIRLAHYLEMTHLEYTVNLISIQILPQLALTYIHT